jgi:hypothetical protein
MTSLAAQLLALAAGHMQFASAARQTVSVHTSLGLVNGERTASGCDRWLGIPYGLPPLRFQAPEAYDRPFPPGGLDATAYKAWCPQFGYDRSVPDAGVETCLFLNVWAPTSGRHLPSVQTFLRNRPLAGCSCGSRADGPSAWLVRLAPLDGSQQTCVRRCPDVTSSCFTAR